MMHWHLYHLIYFYLVLYVGVIFSQSSYFYPFGSAVGDTQHPAVDDACSVTHHHPLTVFGQTYDTFYICTNGIISLNGSYTYYTPASFPLSTNVTIIATFWDDAHLGYGGALWSRESNDTTLLNNVSSIVSNVYGTSFTASWSLVVTWDHVIEYASTNYSITNSFQCVLATDGVSTYALYLYGDIEWIRSSGAQVHKTATLNTLFVANPQSWQVGFDAGDGVNYYAVPDSRTSAIIDIELDSNIGRRGQWMFRLDNSLIQTPAPITTTSTPIPTTTTTLPTTTTTLPTTTTTLPTTTTTLPTTTITFPTTTTTLLTTTTTLPTTTTTLLTTTTTFPTTTTTFPTTTNNYGTQPTPMTTTELTDDSTTISMTDPQLRSTSPNPVQTTQNGSGGGADAQGGNEGNGPDQQTSTIAGSSSAMFALIALVALLLLLIRWKKKQQKIIHFDAEQQFDGDEYFGQAPINHVWPTDLSTIITVKPREMLQSIVPSETQSSHLPTHSDELTKKEQSMNTEMPGERATDQAKHTMDRDLQKSAPTHLPPMNNQLPPLQVTTVKTKPTPNQNQNSKAVKKNQRKVANKTLNRVDNLYGKK